MDAADLVVGDVVDVAAGAIVPADLMLTGGEYLSIDQAALTGESLPVDKAVGDVALFRLDRQAGRHAGRGRRPATRRSSAAPPNSSPRPGGMSHSQKAVVQIGDFLHSARRRALAVVLVGVQVYRTMVVPGHWSLDQAGQIAQFVLVLLVASVPVALPAVMSVTLALGALALSQAESDRLAPVGDRRTRRRRHSLQRQDRHADAEQAHLSDADPLRRNHAEDIVIGAALATKAGSEDAIDVAILKGGPAAGRALADDKQTDFVPFDPVNKRTMTTVVDPSAARHGITPRARRRRFRRCASSTPNREPAYDDKVDELARRGIRALGVGELRGRRKDLDIARLLSLLDPPRPDARPNDRPDQGARARGQDGDRRRRRHRQRDRRSARPRHASSGRQRRIPQGHGKSGR